MAVIPGALLETAFTFPSFWTNRRSLSIRVSPWKVFRFYRDRTTPRAIKSYLDLTLERLGPLALWAPDGEATGVW